MSHVDLTTFRTIISDWFDERQYVECDPYCGVAWHLMDVEEQEHDRWQSLMSKLAPVVWQLKQQGADTKVLSDSLMFWVCVDLQRCSNFQRSLREDLLYLLIEDYFQGQGYKTNGRVCLYNAEEASTSTARWQIDPGASLLLRIQAQQHMVVRPEQRTDRQP